MVKIVFNVFLVYLIINNVFSVSISTTSSRKQKIEYENHKHMHPHPSEIEDNARTRAKRMVGSTNYEETAQFWNIGAQLKLREQLMKKSNYNMAKNVIFFLGDGMSIPTLAAARMYLGQQQGQSGEESKLFFEDFPDVGLAKTYCVDKQVSDSASTATAYLCGVKANYGTLGVTAAVDYNDCEESIDTQNHVDSIMVWAQKAGKGTGIVTTTRVTHASPAGAYAHVANREWECDADVIFHRNDPNICPDIASQMVYNDPGRKMKVILGGGRKKFFPKNKFDERGSAGQRLDGVDLISEWKASKPGQAKYVSTKEKLLSVDFNRTEYLLGLFESDHMKYNLDSNPNLDVSILDMTYAAIKMLEKEPLGYVLFVEGGRIDHAHHETKARKSLDETTQFAEAVMLAKRMTKTEDTLIVVTADHSHTMSLSGYADRGNDILGLNSQPSDKDNKPYTTLSYANGPGQLSGRTNLIGENLNDKNFQYPKIVPMKYETHGGDDVAVFALGPFSHLFNGLYEQNVIPHAIGYAACIGNGLTVCNDY